MNCGRLNKEYLTTLARLEAELNSVRKLCQIEIRNPFEQINSSTIHMSDSFNGNLTNCSLALNLTTRELEKCLIDEVKIRNQIEVINKTLIDVKCQCNITCHNLFDDKTIQIINANLQVPKPKLTSKNGQGKDLKTQANRNNTSFPGFGFRSLNPIVSKTETTTQIRQVETQNLQITSSPPTSLSPVNLTAPKVKSRITDETRQKDQNQSGSILISSNNVLVPSAVMAEVFSSDEDDKMEFNQIENSVGKERTKPKLEV